MTAVGEVSALPLAPPPPPSLPPTFLCVRERVCLLV